ncbi:MAG: YbbR-like domain-containing protein [Prevotella sp.]|uniref:YbbR-like domain-containing protein n=1 Tax=Prevotella sp. TaxID=59823 RepID=UPI002A2F41A2|nr:YbbR-like domain-containing protein [Prevotella sp.]MDD7317494.1 YbbR-like domain-containing protein [Prevotellaceae bacterium]MDY4019170.1 YbbR-like domain-containing protein [Prevotella sp.]
MGKDREVKNISRKIRDFLFNNTNKEFLIFLFFLVISGGFWLLLAMNEDTDKEILVPVKLINVPKNVVVTTNTEDTLRVNVRDKGFLIMGYVYGNQIRPIEIDFSKYADEKHRSSIGSADLQRMIYQTLFSSTKITAVRPDHFDIVYTYGHSKKVPVKMSGRIDPDESHYLANVKFWPDSVLVYAADELIDNIKEAYTEPIYIQNFADTVTRNVSLKRIYGAKFMPAQVKIGLYPDIMTEQRLEVQITAVNMPAGKVLRTFPQRVRVVFVTGASMYRSIRPESFKVVADYNDIVANPSDKCAIRVVAVPHGVRNVRPEIDKVDYLIEEL